MLLGTAVRPAAAPAQGIDPAAPPPPVTSPALDDPAAPFAPAPALRGLAPLVRRGFQFGAGIHHLTVRVPSLGLSFRSSTAGTDGASLALDWVLDGLRLGYMRQVFRREPKAHQDYLDGSLVNLGYESDQGWLFHGWRPWPNLFLGYGAGLAQREISINYRPNADKTVLEETRVSETVAMVGLLVDWAFAPPFSLQARSVREEGGHLFEVTGETIFFAYTVPFE